MSATTLINVASATTAELLAFFNANTGGNPVKKFADRKTAERRVQTLVDEMAEEIGFGDKLEEDERMEPDSTDIQIMQLEAAVAVVDNTSSVLPAPTDDFAEVTEEQHAEHRAEVSHKLDRRNATGPRPEMVASLKIDRRIVDLLTGEEYKNAMQVYRAGMVSYSQCDRLSAVLYGAFKKTGKRDAICKINGHSFRLAYL